jgi:glycerol-3-phosphate O-acyltransferase / dihydroxyacetone phosphate acyltransferase
MENLRTTPLPSYFAHRVVSTSPSRLHHQCSNFLDGKTNVTKKGQRFVTVNIYNSFCKLKLLTEALAKSTVKIQARDVVATWKVLISLGLAPILYALYAIVVTVIAAKAGASLKWKILTPITLICALPFVGYAALKFGEAGMDVLKYDKSTIHPPNCSSDSHRSLRPLIVALVPGQQKSLNKLKAMRVELSNELADVINTFGPQYYEDFDEVSPTSVLSCLSRS